MALLSNILFAIELNAEGVRVNVTELPIHLGLSIV